MGRSGTKTVEPSIDKAQHPREDVANGWLLSIFSNMDMYIFNKPLPPTPSRYAKSHLYPRKQRRPPPRLITSQRPLSPKGFDLGFSEWSGSDTTFENFSIPEADSWDSYFWSKDKPAQIISNSDSSTHNDSNLSLFGRDFSPPNLSGLTINECATLRRSAATRRGPKPLLHNTYPQITSMPPARTAHNSWPDRYDSQSRADIAQRPMIRNRAFTSPAKYDPPQPSNLSSSITLSNGSSPCPSLTSSSSSGLYLHSAPVTPGFAPPFMNLMEKSCFEDDSDDEFDEPGRLAALATRLHIRGGGVNSPGSDGKKETPVKNQKSLRNLKNAGSKMKTMLGMKRSLEDL